IGCSVTGGCWPCARSPVSSAAIRTAIGNATTRNARLRVIISLPSMLSVYPSDRAIAALVLGHGAGSGQHSGFMVEAGRQLSARAIVVATFNFPYIAAGRKSPDKAPVLEEAWRAAIAEARADEAFRSLPLFIGGKSMGGRIASHVAAQGVEGVSGLVFLGYPLHPPGRPQQRRDAHLTAIAAPGGPRSAGAPPSRRSPSRCFSCRAAATSSARPARSASCCRA